MSGLSVLLLVAITSAGACWFGAVALRLPARRLGVALGMGLETLGMALAFLALNAVVGVAGALAVRAFPGGFLSVYFVADERLPVLALVQGLVFQFWRRAK